MKDYTTDAFQRSAQKRKNALTFQQFQKKKNRLQDGPFSLTLQVYSLEFPT